MLAWVQDVDVILIIITVMLCLLEHWEELQEAQVLTCNVQRLSCEPWMLVKEPCHENLKVRDGFVVTCVVILLARCVAEPRPGRGVDVDHVCGFGPAEGVGV